MTDIKTIPEPTDLPPESRKAWRALLKVVAELENSLKQNNNNVKILSKGQNRVFTAVQTQAQATAEQAVAVEVIAEEYVPTAVPLIPTTPTLTSGVATVTIEWDGNLLDVPGQDYDSDGNPIGTPGPAVPVPASETTGFRYVYAERSPTGVYGDPGDDEYVSDWERVGQPLTQAGRIIVKETMGDHLYYRLNTVSYSGTESGPGSSADITVVGVSGPDIEANSVTANEIAAGAIDGMIITGALVQSDAAADIGVKLDNSGFKAYNASGDQTFDINASTGEVTFYGDLLSADKLTIQSKLIIRDTAVTSRQFEINDSRIQGRNRITSAAAPMYLNIDGGDVIVGNLSTGGSTSVRATSDLNLDSNGNVNIAAKDFVSIGQIGTNPSHWVQLFSNNLVQLGNTFGGAGIDLDVTNDTIDITGININIGWNDNEKVNVIGHIINDNLPYAMARGRVTITPTAAGTATSATVSFPSGRFTEAPNVVASVSSPNATVGVSAITTSGCTLTIIRNSTTNTVVQWDAVQMTESSADG